MVKARDINKDIREIGKKVGTAIFAYEDIFNSEVNNEYHYDYNKVIKGYAQTKNISLKEAEESLVEQRILRPLPNGEYKVEVGKTTETGGGLNYHGEVFFTFNQKDYTTKYHELAHSLQRKYNLFSEDKIKAKYDVAERGLTEEQKKDLLIDKGNYCLYLNEMHSESFAYAAMMLRSSNDFDFIRQMSSAYIAGSGNNFEATLSFGKTTYDTKGSGNPTKFYATRPVMKATIKAIKKIRKEKKVGEFFDEKGVVRDEKLAKLCENIVMESAYSPRTLNSFFKYKVLDNHNSEEHGWRLDAIKSFVQAPVDTVMMFAMEGNLVGKLKKIAALDILKKDSERKLNKYIKKPNKCDNPEMQALKEYERLQLKILQMDNKFPNDYLSYSLSDKLPNMANHIANGAVLRHIAEHSSQKSRVYKNLIEFNNIIALNHSNPYFKQLLQAQPNTITLRTMMKDLNENPDKKVFAEYNLQPKKIKHGLITYSLKNNMNAIEDLTQKHQLNPAIQQSLLNIMVNNPELLKYNSTRNKLCKEHQIKGDFLGIKKRKFYKEFNKVADSMYNTYYNLQDDTKYKEVIKELKNIPIDDNFAKSNMEKIVSLEKEERAEQQAHSALRREVYNGLDDMEEKLESNREDYHKAGIETVKAFAALDKDERAEILKSQHPEIKETLQPLVEKLPQRALSKEEIANLEIEITKETTGNAAPLPDKDNSAEKQTSNNISDRITAVEEKLTSWGIDKSSYMVITPEDNVHTSFNGTESRSMQTCFEECKKDLQTAGTNIVFGSNNGVTAAYFAEDVYIVSKNPDLRNVLYHKGSDTNIAVVTSNGEEFRTSTNEPDIKRNQEYAKISEYKPKEQVTEKEQTQTITLPTSYKEKLDALSGRPTEKVSTNIQITESYVQQPEKEPVVIQTPEIARAEAPKQQPVTQPAAVAKEEPQSFEQMNKQEKSKFVHRLRLGFNSFLARINPEKERTLSNQNAQQLENPALTAQIASKKMER